MFYGADLLGWNGNGKAQERCPAAPGLGVYPVTPHPWWILIEGADEPDWSGMLSKASLQNLLPCKINASHIPLQAYLWQQELSCPVFHGLRKRTTPQLMHHGTFCSGVFGNSLQVPPLLGSAKNAASLEDGGFFSLLCGKWPCPCRGLEPGHFQPRLFQDSEFLG